MFVSIFSVFVSNLCSLISTSMSSTKMVKDATGICHLGNRRKM